MQLYYSSLGWTTRGGDGGVSDSIVFHTHQRGLRCGRTPHSYRSNVRGNGCGVQ